jgi:hypothetical protein
MRPIIGYILQNELIAAIITIALFYVLPIYLSAFALKCFIFDLLAVVVLFRLILALKNAYKAGFASYIKEPFLKKPFSISYLS